MRILCVNQFFWPDSAPTGLLLRELSEHLIERGHRVDVLCSDSGYQAESTGEPPQATVHRIRSFAFSRSAPARLLSWLSFLAGAIIKSLCLQPYDLILVMTTPPGLSYLGWLHRLLRRTPFWIWEMDLYPDVAFGTGKLQKQSATTRLLSYLMNKPRHAAAGLIALGTCMKERLHNNGIPERNIVVAENWTTLEVHPAKPIPKTGPIVVLYSGNLGLAHETQTISSVMLALRSDSRFRFEFAGGGARYVQLKDFCERNQIRNAEFLPFHQPNVFTDRIAKAHVGLITLEPECLGTVVPSKFYTLLAAGRPILFIGPGAATPARHIKSTNCGWQHEAGDATGVIALLYTLADNPHTISEAAKQSREAYTHYHSQQPGLQQLIRCLTGGHS